MAKMYTYVILIAGIVLMCNLFLGISTPTGQLWEILMHPENIQSMDLWSFISASLTSLAGAISAIMVGFFYSRVDLAVMAGLLTTVFTELIFALVQIYAKVNSASHELALLLFAPIIVGMIIVAIEWWRGRD
jgi:hypothetical protein